MIHWDLFFCFSFALEASSDENQMISELCLHWTMNLAHFFLETDLIELLHHHSRLEGP